MAICYKFNVHFLIVWDFEHPPNGYVRALFHAGQDTATFDLKIYNDEILERDEKFRVSIVEVSLPFGVSLGDTTTANVSIIDKNSKCNYVIC